MNTISKSNSDAACAASVAAPDGWKLVPVEPTPEMVAAMHFKGDVDMAIGHAQFYKDATEDYAAMLAVAPEAPKTEIASVAALEGLTKHYGTLRRALQRIEEPADAGCGCSFPCRCNTPEAEAFNAEAMRDEAAEALKATPGTADVERLFAAAGSEQQDTQQEHVMPPTRATKAWPCEEEAFRKVGYMPAAQGSEPVTLTVGVGEPVTFTLGSNITLGSNVTVAAQGSGEQVGCEREDGLLNIHAESETCEVCAAPPVPSAAHQTEPKMTIRNGTWWPEGYCTDPNGAIVAPAGKHTDFKFGYDIGYADGLVAHRDSVKAIENRIRTQNALVAPETIQALEHWFGIRAGEDVAIDFSELYGFCLSLSKEAASPATSHSEPVAEVILGPAGDQTGVRWCDRIPDIGTKLYAITVAPSDPQQAVQGDNNV